MTRAIVIGSEGQDGRILFDRLKGEGCAVLGIGRDSVRGDAGVSPLDISSRDRIFDLIRDWQPDEIYYLAAVHQASEDFAAADEAQLFDRSVAIHATAPIYMLDAVRRLESHARFFYASSSLVFGDVVNDCQDEQTPVRPRDIYGITKAAGMNVCSFFRDTHGVHASVGILYNHESSLRKRSFVSQKIIRGALDISRGERRTLEIGNLSARIDWGYAPDFIDAMIRIVRQPEADDYIVATGEAHTVQEFIEIAFGRLGLDWRKYVVEDRSLLTRRFVTRVGNAARLRERTGWRPTVTFTEMIEMLVDFAERNVV